MGSHNLMYKCQLYEEAFGVPFIVRWPGKIRAGSREHMLLSVPDVMPSLLGLMGLRGRIPAGVEGRDYSSAFLGKPTTRPASVPYLRIDTEHPKHGERGVRTAKYSFAIRRTDRSQTMILYDNQRDPYQLKNVADGNPALIQELTGELNRWLERTKDPWGRV